nr:probable cyclic nucleotide-gated ion channel 5 [Tanacetum cinerariifolium]
MWKRASDMGALDEKSRSNLPSSIRTVKALREVEGFALSAYELKFVVAWRRHCKRKILEQRCKEEVGLTALVPLSWSQGLRLMLFVGSTGTGIWIETSTSLCRL